MKDLTYFDLRHNHIYIVKKPKNRTEAWDRLHSTVLPKYFDKTDKEDYESQTLDSIIEVEKVIII